MGRLYWKFFFFFLFAQLTSVFGVGLAVWAHNRSQENSQSLIEASPPAMSVLVAVSATLEHGGVEATRKMLEGWPQRRMPQVFVVNEAGEDLLQRRVAPELLQHAISELDKDEAVRSIHANDGHQYLLFVPARTRGGQPSFNDGMEGPQGPPPDMHDPSGMRQPPPGELSDDRPPPPPQNSGMRSRFWRVFPLVPLSAGVIASLVFAALLAWYFSKPIRSLRQAFITATDGDLEVRVAGTMGHRRDELSDLGRDFDTMASRLGALLQGQSRLLHHVSHELRSPLARMQMAIGLARQSPEKVSSSLERIERESMRMDKLVGELLAFSRLESGVTNIHKERLELSDLLFTLAEDAQFEAKDRKIEVRLLPHDDFVLEAQPDLLHRALENIIRNALKYGPDGSDVDIDVTSDPDAHLVFIRIRDQGMGVAPHELETIFQPFYRANSGLGSDGHGIGLALAKQVVEMHGGKISARNISPVGFEISVQLPYLD
ncbi:HAMP domain-containing sensor histidine kinase [Methylovorus mays]|uniref:HAMP domain-containing sensor histidine kinase n=1 Tax=Methylovorus mays TaxID=184077 RepID=UPI001E656F3F|nr:HAMP domain-containing sensor histidine kinase [Methylovorus mays]MCB5206434.1 HAMP domain-containing histidine kinase [Methylovorus mays]